MIVCGVQTYECVYFASVVFEGKSKCENKNIINQVSVLFFAIERGKWAVSINIKLCSDIVTTTGLLLNSIYKSQPLLFLSEIYLI